MSEPARNRRERHSRETIRRMIRDAALRLFVERGTSSVSMGDIAERVGVTRANLHYHFGTKGAVVEAVFSEHLQDVEAAYRAIWLDENSTLRQKTAATAADCRARFYRFNDGPRGTRPWSLSGQARFGGEQLPDPVEHTLQRFSKALERCVRSAVKQAVVRGELRPDAPVESIVLLLTANIYFGPPITQYTGGIARLERHFAATAETVMAAYGT